MLSHLDWEHSGMCLRPLRRCRGIAQLFSAKHGISQTVGHCHFSESECSSNTHVLGNLFGEISHASGSYGPCQPCWVLVEHDIRYVSFYDSINISLFGEIQLFQIIVNMN